SVNIGTIYSCLPVFSYKIHYMNQNYPNIKFNIVHRDPHSLLQLLEKGEIDVLFLRTPTCQTGGFSSHILQEDIFTLVVNKNLDPCPESTEIEIAQLKDIPLCMLRTGKYWGYNEILISACKKSGFEPNIICECYDTSIAMMMVIMGIGFSYQPMDIVLALNNPDIYPKIINGFEIKTFPLLIWNDKKYLPRAVRLFLSLFDVKTAQNQFS
ncbi:MAG: LysR family transcriptional regulator substrate-binding protein, partial [Clostridiales bacterium]